MKNFSPPGELDREVEEPLRRSSASRLGLERFIIGGMFGWLKQRRRRRVLAGPVPEQWRGIIERNVWQAATLTEAERSTLADRLRVFLDEKDLEGCGGMALTDEVRVTVAAYACLLTLHLDPESYDRVASVLIYPTSYYAPSTETTPEGFIREAREHRAGEAWMGGAGVVSWGDLMEGDAGSNVVIHEFAHQLDMRTRTVDGTPPQPDGQRVRAWRSRMRAEHAAMAEAVAQGRWTLLPAEAAADLGEFFAAASEAFFEEPQRFRSHEPELYRMLAEYYGLDLAERLDTAKG